MQKKEEELKDFSKVLNESLWKNAIGRINDPFESFKLTALLKLNLSTKCSSH